MLHRELTSKFMISTSSTNQPNPKAPYEREREREREFDIHVHSYMYSHFMLVIRIYYYFFNVESGAVCLQAIDIEISTLAIVRLCLFRIMSLCNSLRPKLG